MRTALAFLVLGVTISSAQTGVPERPVYDGHWWIGHPNRQLHLGYLAGEGACYHYDLKGPNRKLRSIYSAIKLVDVYYYDITPANLNKPLPELLGELDDHIEKILEGGEVHPGKYGYYDGMWWHSPGDPANLGFVEGFISCLPLGYRIYPATAAFYEKKISEWYEAGGPERRDEKIPNVLSRFRAGAPPAAEK